MKKFYCSVSAILCGICLIFSLLPVSAFAQREYHERYWLYYDSEGSAYVERYFKYGGYEDKVFINKIEHYRSTLSDSARVAYDRERMEFAKTLVFYTKGEIERGPVKLKPKDWYNKAVRRGEHPTAVFPL